MLLTAAGDVENEGGEREDDIPVGGILRTQRLLAGQCSVFK